MVLFVVVVVVAMIVFKNPAMLAQAGQAVMYGVIIGFMLLCFALVNLIGTWVITARAKAKAKRPKDAATMIADSSDRPPWSMTPTTRSPCSFATSAPAAF